MGQQHYNAGLREAAEGAHAREPGTRVKPRSVRRCASSPLASAALTLSMAVCRHPGEGGVGWGGGEVGVGVGGYNQVPAGPYHRGATLHLFGVRKTLLTGPPCAAQDAPQLELLPLLCLDSS